MAKKDVVSGKMWQPRGGNQDVMTLDETVSLVLNTGQLLIGDIEISSALDEVVTLVIDNGASAITPGVKGRIYLPYTTEITDWVVGGTPQGSITIDLWVDSHANFPPINADSITGSTPIVVSDATHARMSTLAGWTTVVPADSWVLFNVDSCVAMSSVTIALKTTRSL